MSKLLTRIAIILHRIKSNADVLHAPRKCEMDQKIHCYIIHIYYSYIIINKFHMKNCQNFLNCFHGRSLRITKMLLCKTQFSPSKIKKETIELQKSKI